MRRNGAISTSVFECVDYGAALEFHQRNTSTYVLWSGRPCLGFRLLPASRRGGAQSADRRGKIIRLLLNQVVVQMGGEIRSVQKRPRIDRHHMLNAVLEFAYVARPV